MNVSDLPRYFVTDGTIYDRATGKQLKLDEAVVLLETTNPHSCIYCPVEVRDLHACAYNAVVNYNSGRCHDAMVVLKEAVERYQPGMDAHFAAVKKP